MEITPRIFERAWGRVFGSGLKRVVAVAVCALALAGCASSGAVYPSFLPKKTLNPHVDAVLMGTMAKPALQIEGLPVLVETRTFHVRITVSGPVVPGEGLPDQPPATTCTWTVMMKDASADVPISIADFHSVDHLGSVFLMGLVPGEHAPPRFIRPGQTVTFKLRAYELVGEGMMQWAPDHKHVVAYWDYTVEND
ncbi:MAG: hypothetical protein WAM64_11015 [Acidimicrobiales bacterium]